MLEKIKDELYLEIEELNDKINSLLLIDKIINPNRCMMEIMLDEYYENLARKIADLTIKEIELNYQGISIVEKIKNKINEDKPRYTTNIIIKDFFYGTFLSSTLYNSVAVFGTASTGTKISSLNGIAKTNAILASIGLGSIESGGFGISGGTIVLFSIATLPIFINLIKEVNYISKLERVKKTLKESIIELKVICLENLNEENKKIQLNNIQIKKLKKIIEYL